MTDPHHARPRQGRPPVLRADCGAGRGRLRLAVVSAVAVLAAMVIPARAAPPPRGTLILAGGALSDGNADVYGEIVRRAGGAGARIGVITAASLPPSADPGAGTASAANSESNGRFYVDILKRYGAGEVRWLPIDLDHPGAADGRELAGEAGSMTGFVFGGGDQSRLVTTLMRGRAHTDSRVLAAIRERFSRGAVVAGTSAGAQIQEGRDMVTGGASYQALRDGSRRGYFEESSRLGYLAEGGFGFFGDGLVDTHFSAFGRLGRAVRLASDTGHVRVFGLDPDTALELSAGSMRVLGRHGVSVLDLRDAVTGARGGHWAISGVRWSYLTAGMTYRPGAWSAGLPAGARALVPEERVADSPVRDVFDSPAAGRDEARFALTSAALDLARSARSVRVIGTSYESEPRFTVELVKGGGFRAYLVGGAVAFTDLVVSIHGS